MKNSNKAITLVELLVSSIILSIALSGIGFMLVYLTTFSQDIQIRAIAQSYADIINNSITNEVRNAAVVNLSNNNQVQTMTILDRRGSIVSTYQFDTRTSVLSKSVGNGALSEFNFSADLKIKVMNFQQTNSSNFFFDLEIGKTKDDKVVYSMQNINIVSRNRLLN